MIQSKDGQTIFISRGGLGKWKVPEREEIHDIIGYDEALLKEFSGTAAALR